MTTTINASPSNGLVQSADGSGILKVQSNGVTTNALAWVNFDGGTSPGTIRSQYNVSSVTRSSTGVYVINFTNALTDANYAGIVSAGDGSSSSAIGQAQSGTPTTTTFTISVINYLGTASNRTYVNAVVFGN